MDDITLAGAIATAVLFTVGFGWLAWVRPTSSAAAVLALNHLTDYDSVLPIHFWHLTLLVLGIAMLRIAYAWYHCGIPITQAVQRPLVALMLIAILVILWFKIIADTVVYGLDEYRSFSLWQALLTVGPEVVILALGAAVLGVKHLVQGLVLGFTVLTAVVTLPWLPAAILNGQLTAALEEGSRLNMFSQDTINGSRPWFLGAIGALLALDLPTVGAKLKILALSSLSLNAVLLLLNGTRQFLAAVAFAWFLQFLGGGSALRKAGASVLLGCLVAAAVWFCIAFDVTTTDRLTGEALERGTDLRGGIWAEAFESALEHPFLGPGFRNFGQFTEIANPVDGTRLLLRDNAHGYIQDAFAEHGLIFGTVFFTLWLWAIAACFRLRLRSPVPEVRTGALLALVLQLPYLVSGTLTNSFGLYYLAVFLASGFEASEHALGPLSATGGRPKPGFAVAQTYGECHVR